MYLSATRKGSVEWQFAYVVRVWSIILIVASAIAAPAFGQAIVNFDTSGCAGKLGAKCERNFGPVAGDADSVTVKAVGWYCTKESDPDVDAYNRTALMDFFQTGEKPFGFKPREAFVDTGKTLWDDNKSFDEKALALGYAAGKSVTKAFDGSNEAVVSLGYCYTRPQMEKLLKPIVEAAKAFCDANPCGSIAN